MVISKKRWIKFLFISICACSLLTAIVNAAGERMTWSGAGILAKASNGSFRVSGNTSITISNTVTKATYVKSMHAMSSIRRLEWFGWYSFYTLNQYNLGQAQARITIQGGTYSMHFYSDPYIGPPNNRLDMNGYIK